eukprot:8880522-Ditylum_brightwellii.AAC.1
MESAAALMLTIKMHKEENILVEAIVADNDSSMKSVVRHSFQEKEARKDLFPTCVWPKTGNTKQKSTGQPPLHIPEPRWHADPTHRTKVAGKHLLEI